MKTAGDLIKQKRLEENISQEELGEMTHIKKSFIEAVENSDWEKLPELPVVVGFVKSISHFLNMDDIQTVALLKREYKPIISKIEKQKRGKEITKRFIWGPRMTFFALVVIVLLSVLGYLGFQYQKFNLPPKLILNEPTQNEVIKTTNLTVQGMTDPDATIEVNNQPVIVAQDGSFATTLNVSAATNEIKVVSKARSGKESTISRKIEVKL